MKLVCPSEMIWNVACRSMKMFQTLEHFGASIIRSFSIWTYWRLYTVHVSHWATSGWIVAVSDHVSRYSIYHDHPIIPKAVLGADIYILSWKITFTFKFTARFKHAQYDQDMCCHSNGSSICLTPNADGPRGYYAQTGCWLPAALNLRSIQFRTWTHRS